MIAPLLLCCSHMLGRLGQISLVIVAKTLRAAPVHCRRQRGTIAAVGPRF